VEPGAHKRLVVGELDGDHVCARLPFASLPSAIRTTPATA
jgi:hypothetical protein